MDLRDTPDEARFRNEAAAWLAGECPGRPAGAPRRGSAVRRRRLRDWSRDALRSRLRRAHLAEGLRGWRQAVQLPGDLSRGARPCRGAAASRRDRARHGRADDHRVRHRGPQGPLPAALLSAEEIWCQGFSEPDAGSDLSAVRTSARLEGSRFVVDGQKVWSSYAHIADWCILVTRSDPAPSGTPGSPT